MKQDSEDKLAHVLEALENPSSFTQEELKSLFSDKECLRYARTILYAKESLARQQIPQPDIDKEWRTFECHHKKNINYSNNNRSGDSFLHCFVFYI